MSGPLRPSASRWAGPLPSTGSGTRERRRGAPLRLSPLVYRDLLGATLRADLGAAGDITSDAVVPADAMASGSLVARAAGRICGLEIALDAFRIIDPEIEIEALARDGRDVSAGEPLARVQGRARSLLAAERTALNFLGHLSGVATATRDLVERVGDSPARIVCTRKTTPGLRALEKYAVRAGGGANHRFGLHDAVLIKDNHLVIGGGVTETVRRARESVGHLVKVEVEVDTMEQLREALDAGADVVLLDNMPPELLAEAVALARPRGVLTEASGGVGPENIAAVAATGVDLISVGWITHSAPSLDVALDFATG